ncbi:MAG TPA: hypothetical protein VFI62_01640, partial [Burkholderiales bacterium]|nr:hypothetical protein [Burkholderiales bacterium]
MRTLRSFARLAVIIAILIAFVLIPFALWGDQLDAYTPSLLSDPSANFGVALMGMALLIGDVLLPIPSSVVSVLLCAALGPIKGAIVVMAGMVGAFLLGDRIGRFAPKDALRRWIGMALWDWCVVRAQTWGVLWIAVTRPIPVLAELTAVLAGVLSVPLMRSMPMVLVSCAGVSIGYALTVWVGLQQASPLTAILIA